MALDLLFPNPVESSARDVFGMTEAHRLTEDIECQRAGMIDYLDILNYMNGNSFDDRAQTRHAVAYLACAMLSIAYIDPQKTREMIYNLGLVVDNIECERLHARVDAYNSDNMTLAERALAAALYRTVSGRGDHDADLHGLCERICTECRLNADRQHIAALDTARGRFEVLPNVMALMALTLADRAFGTNYAASAADVRKLVCEILRDQQTGLFFESYQTGCIGYTGEAVNPAAAWHTTELCAHVNAIDIAFAHWLDPEGCERAWGAFKERFMDELLGIDADSLAASVGCSYVTQLGPVAEGLLGGLLAAKEMGDVEAFDALQNHLLELAGANMWEGHVIFAALGDLSHMIEMFSLFARVHVPWADLFSHDWETYYLYDYREVR